jgi:predicted Zn-dependent protease
MSRSFFTSRLTRVISIFLALTVIFTQFSIPLAQRSGKSSWDERGRNQEPVSPLPPDVQLGLEVSAAIADAIGVDDDVELNERLNRIGYRVAAASEDWDVPYSFTILKLSEPNAMALPGGFLFVTSGMFELGLTDDELAHLIGHEMTHVRKNHHARASRLNTLISLMQTALMVGLMMGSSGSGYGGTRVDVNDDPGLNQWSVGVTGRDALIQGTSMLGGIMQALFDKGYSRKLEFEADEGGNYLAIKAGYSPAGGPAMLGKLQERSYEGQRYGYWRTHPYFNDRLARARARVPRLNTAINVPDDTAYRQQISLYFAAAADKVHNERQALYLYRCAIQAEPERITSLQTALEIVRFKAKREDRKHPLFRLYGPLVADFDSLIVYAGELDPGWLGIVAAQNERDQIESQRAGLLIDYEELLDAEEYATGILHRFVTNYPEHPRHEEMTCLLGSNYYLAERPEIAVELLGDFLETKPQPVWADSARHVLIETIADLDDPTICYRFISEHGANPEGESDEESTRLVAAARERMDWLADSKLSMKVGGAFLQTYPNTEWSDQIRDKVSFDAHKEFENGRVQEGLHNYQLALNIYFTILALAPDSPSTPQATAGIERLRRMEAAGFD